MPTQIAVDPLGRYVYVTSKFPNTPTLNSPYLSIYSITPQGSPNAGALTQVPYSPFPLKNGSITENAYNLSVDPFGRFIFVVDQKVGYIYSYSYNPTSSVLTLIQNIYPPISGGTAYMTTVDPTGKYLIVNFNAGGSPYLSTMLINGMTGILTNVPTYPNCGDTSQQCQNPCSGCPNMSGCANTPVGTNDPVQSMIPFFTVRH